MNDNLKNPFEFAKNLYNDFFLSKDFELKIKNRFWVKKNQDGSFTTILFEITKRQNSYILNYSLFIPCERMGNLKPKPRVEQFELILTRIIDAKKLYIYTDSIYDIKDFKILVQENINLIEKVILPLVDKYLNVSFIKKHFPNYSELNMLDWLPKDEKLIKECLDNFTPS